MNIVALIPARSGSVGLKNKNIKLFNGKPLIYYAIKSAKRPLVLIGAGANRKEARRAISDRRACGNSIDPHSRALIPAYFHT